MTTPADNAAQGGASAPQPGTAEYQAAMVAASNGVPINGVVDQAADSNQEVTPQERPSWLPEKFKTPEEMAASYSELEKKLSGGSQEETPPKQADENQQVPPGVDVNKYSTEFETTGALSEASYAELEKAGINRSMVDAYISGQMALATSYQNAGYEAAGGQERYGQMVEWAKANLPAAEIKAFNSQVGSGDVESMKLAVAGLNSKYIAANGSAPSGLLQGGASPTAATGAFQSRSQVTEAMSDPRYATDPAYRQQVRARLANSNVF